jgi:ATP-binding cassette subfamily C (CFTR/MRP) protein 1
LTLLRILELQSGKIEVDGIDISDVRLGILRQRCFITVAQDALLLSNDTLRLNLDHDSSLTDDNIVDALVRTGLWQHFIGSATTVESVLDKKLSSLPELSAGQCQLFALCRAILRANAMRTVGVKPVILLDEVTSSLDYATESTICRILDEEFTSKGHTVIMIAHRLGALMDCLEPDRDVVALVADGKLQDVITDLTPERFRTLGEMK